MHPLICIEKSAASTYNRGTVSPLCREDTLGHSLLCAHETLYTLYREHAPLHLAEGHSLRCVEKTMSTMYREGVCLLYIWQWDTLCRVWTTSFSCMYREGVCLLYTRQTGTFLVFIDKAFLLVSRERGLPPRLIAKGHSLLHVEGILSPLHREGVCDPPYGAEDHTLLCGEKD